MQVVRFDFPINQITRENSVIVVKVSTSKETAEQEVSRLNKLNADKSCRYNMQVTRLVL